MYLSAHYMKQIKKDDRERKIFNQLLNESEAGNREAKRILNRVLSIDGQIEHLTRQQKNCIDKAHKKFNSYLDKELKIALHRERRILLSLGKRLGAAKTYLRFIKQKNSRPKWKYSEI